MQRRDDSGKFIANPRTTSWKTSSRKSKTSQISDLIFLVSLINFWISIFRLMFKLILPAKGEERKYGGVLQRSIAIMIDCWILTAAIFPFRGSIDKEIIPVLVGFVFISYHFIFTLRFGQTIGKKIMKIRIVNVGTHTTPSKIQFLLRTVLMLLSVFHIPFIALTQKRQGLHDLLSGTVVIKVQ